eukprot:g5970.t1
MTGRRSAAAAARARSADPRPSPRPARASSGDEPATYSIRVTTLYLAGAILLTLGVFLYAGGYKLGFNAGKADFASSLGTGADDDQGPIRDPIQTGQNQPSDPIASTTTPSGSTPRTEPPPTQALREPQAPPIKTGINVLELGSGPIITYAGMAQSDPRAPGVNYVQMGDLPRDQAAAAVEYFAANAERIIAIPLERRGAPSNNPWYRLFSLEVPVPSEQFAAMGRDRRDHIRRIAQIGQRWRREERGPRGLIARPTPGLSPSVSLRSRMDIDRLISDRARAIDASGIRRIFDLGARLKDPINLSIGQPDFPVPEPIKRAAIRAIETDHNGYTPTQGIPPLQARVTGWLKTDLGWDAKPAGSADPGQPSTLITTGTSGALSLAFAALLGPGDEAIIPDPYFVAYPHLCALAGARGVLCDTGDDLRMTAERVEPLITQRTKLVLLNSPSNPCGVVSTPQECRDLLELCRARGVLLISDEIYDEFTYPEFALDTAVGDASIARCPSPARLPGSHEDVLLIRGFGKTYACTGWRLGYAAGPRELIAEMAKIQQYTFVCAPSAFQHGTLATDRRPHARRRLLRLPQDPR